MARVVRFRVVNGIAVITLDSPPVNVISAAVRAALWDVIQRVRSNDEISAAVFAGAGDLFSAGTDLKEVTAAPAKPSLAELCDLIEQTPKPMIAAVHKQALGAAAELIMACHYRLATAQARIGLPDVVLGLTPCGGASQRLPRLVGVDPALQMLLSGHSVEGPAAQVIGLVDGLVDGDLLSGAVTFAQSLLQQGKGPRPTLASRSKLADGRKVAASISAARKSLETNPEHAPDRIVDCVEAAAILPTLAGQAFELDAFARCFEHPQSAALLHVYKAEREIDEALLEREGQAFNPVAPMGMAAVQRLKNALLAAADDLSRNGHSETEIDAACVAYGFRVGPFGGQPAPQANPDVMRRLIAALVAEGAICAEQGAVQRVRDIDALAVHGMGYPRRMGGPMRAAQTLGLLALRNDMRGWAEDSEIWAVPQLLDDAVKIAAGFDGL